MKKSSFWVVFFVLAIGAVAAFFYWKNYLAPGPTTTVFEPSPEPEKFEEPAIRYPVPEPSDQGKVPAPAEVDDGKPMSEPEKSDETLQEALSRLLSGQKLDRLLVLDNFIQRFVLMVDNLTQAELPINRLPAKPAPGTFVAAEKDGSLLISPENYKRYTPYLRLAEAIDTETLAALYVRFYPLIQAAYKGLGYPTGYFNDRLIQVIDHLLTAPEVEQPVRLVQPILRYKYADPELEALSSGRKILIRIGPENAARVKEKLRKFRNELISIRKVINS